MAGVSVSSDEVHYSGVTRLNFPGAEVSPSGGGVTIDVTGIAPGSGESEPEIYDQATPVSPFPGRPYIRVQRDEDGDVQGIWLGTVD